MRSPPRLLALTPLVVAPLALAIGCAPTFTAEGSLVVDGHAFAPDHCEVLPSGGIRLSDASGNQLQLVIPPQRLDAWRSIAGAPDATWTVSGGIPVAVGPCGSLTLTGEGYHGSGRRAASGKAALTCGASPTVQGNLSFTGCF